MAKITATSRKALVMEHCRQSLANAPAVQAWFGVTEAPDPVAAALAKVYVDDIPRSVEALRSAGDWQALRPYIVIRDEQSALEQDSFPTSRKWSIMGMISLTFHANAVYDDPNWDNYLSLINPVGEILDDLANQVETSGRLSFQRIGFETGVQRAFDAEIQEMGDFIFIEAVLEYRSGQ